MAQAANPGSGSLDPVGSGDYKVRAGDCVLSIANEVGHFWQTIWHDPANAELKRVRGAPHVLLAGDRLHIPPLRSKQVAGATDQCHQFQRKGIPIAFELMMKENDEPLVDCDYVLELDATIVAQGTIGSDGIIRVPMSPDTRKGELRVIVDSIERVYPLLFGELDPPHTLTGALGRLENLGYTSSDDEEAFALALACFQKDQKLPASGQLNEATVAKLAEIHGS